MFEPPLQDNLLRLRVRFQAAELPEPPMATMPAVGAWSPELTRRQQLSETFAESGPQRAVLELRYIAAKVRRPDIRPSGAMDTSGDGSLSTADKPGLRSSA